MFSIGKYVKDMKLKVKLLNSNIQTQKIVNFIIPRLMHVTFKQKQNKKKNI